MIDLMDRFVMFLMNEFYESLNQDMKRWLVNLNTAVEDNNEKNIETALRYIKDTRELMNDLSDENMEIKDY